jgi:hypothetical protein
VRPNVDVVSEPLTSVMGDGIVTEGGNERTIIFATGFETTSFLAR